MIKTMKSVRLCSLGKNYGIRRYAAGMRVFSKTSFDTAMNARNCGRIPLRFQF